MYNKNIYSTRIMKRENWTKVVLEQVLTKNFPKLISSDKFRKRYKPQLWQTKNKPNLSLSY